MDKSKCYKIVIEISLHAKIAKKLEPTFHLLEKVVKKKEKADGEVPVLSHLERTLFI